MLGVLRRILQKASAGAKAPRRAGVYAKPGLLLVHSMRTTTAGVDIVDLDVHHLPAPFAAAAVGAAARVALAAHQHDVSHPTDWAEVSRGFLSACHVRSWKALESDARFCGIELSLDGTIRLSSTRNGGRSGDEKGFQPNGAPDSLLSANVTDGEFGEAILATIENCT